MKLSNLNSVALKSFVVPTLILLTIILIIPFAFMPLLNNVKKTNDSLKEQQNRLKKLSTKLDVLNSLDEQDINEKLSLAEQALPVGKSLPQLVLGLQNLAMSADKKDPLMVEGISLSPGRVSTESATKETASSSETEDAATQANTGEREDILVLQLKLKGKLSSVEKFLAKLQRGKRLSFADNVNLGSSEEIRGYTIEIRLLIPFRPVPKVEGDVLEEPIVAVSDQNLETLKLVDDFFNFTNIQINEVPTNIVKDPFKGK